MTIKQNKNKILLPDNLYLEKYIVTFNYDSNNKNYINSPSTNTQNNNLLQKNKEIKPKSSYILFVQETTNILKNTNSEMTPAERKKEVSRLWQIKKNS